MGWLVWSWEEGYRLLRPLARQQYQPHEFAPREECGLHMGVCGEGTYWRTVEILRTFGTPGSGAMYWSELWWRIFLKDLMWQ